MSTAAAAIDDGDDDKSLGFRDALGTYSVKLKQSRTC